MNGNDFYTAYMLLAQRRMRDGNAFAAHKCSAAAMELALVRQAEAERRRDGAHASRWFNRWWWACECNFCALDAVNRQTAGAALEVGQ